MKQRFFNIIPGTDSCCMLLYGEIGEWGDALRSADIVKELMEAAATYQKIDVRINSKGGEVHAGIAIFNALRNCKADITIYIDGIAASIASIIAMCGQRVEMSKHARLMLHGVSGGTYGTKEEIASLLEEVESLEQTLCDILVEKTGQTPEQIKESYFDGKDHWLKADEALALGLIDAVYDADPLPEDSTPEQVYTAIQNRFNNKSNHTKMLDKLKKRPSFANCADEDQALEQVGTLEAEAAKVPGLEKENQELKAERDARRAADEEAAAAAVESELDQALQENRITEPEKEEFRAMFKATPEVAKAQLARRKPGARIVNELERGAGTGGSAWENRMKELRERNNKR